MANKEVEELIKQSDIFHQLGLENIPEEDKKAIYHLAKVFVYPSFYEGYGYPVVEAISSNTLVITSHTSSLTEIESDKIIFINPNDINDLFQALKESMAKFL